MGLLSSRVDTATEKTVTDAKTKVSAKPQAAIILKGRPLFVTYLGPVRNRELDLRPFYEYIESAISAKILLQVLVCLFVFSENTTTTYLGSSAGKKPQNQLCEISYPFSYLPV